MDASFLSLIGGCIAGDGPSWEAFFSEYFSIATQLLNHRYPSFTPAENDDIIQNVFMKLSRGGLKNFKGTTGYEFIAYFKQITKNEAFTWLKQKNRRAREISIEESDPEDDDAPSPPILADNSFRPDKAIEIKNLLEARRIQGQRNRRNHGNSHGNGGLAL